MVHVCKCCISWNAFYYVPEPGLFLAMQKPEMQDLYFINWLWCRDLLVYRLSSADFDAPPCPILHGAPFRLGGSISHLVQMPLPAERLTKAACCQLDIQKLLGQCQQEISIGSKHEASVTWQGQTYDLGSSLPDDIKCDVLYDLYETGFYIDLVSLDDSANTSDMDPRLCMELV